MKKFTFGQSALIKKFSRCYCCGEYAALAEGDINLVLSGYEGLKISCSDEECKDGYGEYVDDLNNSF